MKIYIVFKEDDPFNFKFYKIFWVWKHTKLFLNRNMGFSWKKRYFELGENDPLKKTIDIHLLMRKYKKQIIFH